MPTYELPEVEEFGEENEKSDSPRRHSLELPQASAWGPSPGEPPTSPSLEQIHVGDGGPDIKTWWTDVTH